RAAGAGRVARPAAVLRPLPAPAGRPAPLLDRRCPGGRRPDLRAAALPGPGPDLPAGLAGPAGRAGRDRRAARPAQHRRPGPPGPGRAGGAAGRGRPRHRGPVGAVELGGAAPLAVPHPVRRRLAAVRDADPRLPRLPAVHPGRGRVLAPVQRRPGGSHRGAGHRTRPGAHRSSPSCDKLSPASGTGRPGREGQTMETWVVVLIVIAVIALIIWGIVSMVHVLQE